MRVDIGMPVRNGASTLRRALDSVLRQTHRDIQVILSDNASTDATADIGLAAARADGRVRFIRHARPLTALAHFRYVFEQSTTRYFLWAAHDDWRSENFVELLLQALESRPRASVAMSDVVLFDDLADAGNLCALALDLATEGLPIARRLRSTVHNPPFAIYGLIRRASLSGYPWYESEYAPDWPIMLWLAARGEFVHVPGAHFLYHWPAGKDDQVRARANAYRRPRLLFRERVAWLCACAVARGQGARSPLAALAWLPRIYVWQHRGVKNLLFSRAPAVLQRSWRRFKASPRDSH